MSIITKTITSPVEYILVKAREFLQREYDFIDGPLSASDYLKKRKPNLYNCFKKISYQEARSFSAFQGGAYDDVVLIFKDLFK